MTVFTLFLVEILAMRFAKFGHNHDEHGHVEAAPEGQNLESASKGINYHDEPSSSDVATTDDELRQHPCPAESYVPGADHLSHSRDHQDHETTSHGQGGKTFDPDSYAARLVALAVLEFGVIFHSVFIGITLAVGKLPCKRLAAWHTIVPCHASIHSFPYSPRHR